MARCRRSGSPNGGDCDVRRGVETAIQCGRYLLVLSIRKQQVLGSNPSVGSSDLNSEASREAGFLRAGERREDLGG